MRIALDATYSLSTEPSGVGVYSREILNGAAALEGAEIWDWFYRSQRYWRSWKQRLPHNVRRRFLSDSWGNRSADLFHGLNQRLPRKPFRKQIVTFHDLFVMTGDYSSPEFRSRFTAQAREAASRADLVIAVSEFTARQVSGLLEFDADRIRVIHHGTTPRNLPSIQRENIILCVGAIQRRKNQAGLVRAFRAAPSDWKLVLAGSRGFGAEEVIREIETSSCADRIVRTGYVSESDLSVWYARASIFAFPSLDEGFGMPILDAMAAGIPVICGNRSALPEVAGDAAIQVDPERGDELSEALRVLCAEPPRRQELAARGRARSKLFSWQTAVDRTLTAYREVLR
ncbi:MAG TPA: glycosyltransferase family 1 protein [Bryobacteraceae bacterium]|nr:glycosyltransferase family 1 protein [Bryobacteraceae bacterium]